MATFKINGQSYVLLADKITSPSIKIKDAFKTGTYMPGYIPLFSGSKGSVVRMNFGNYDYNFTLGGLKVDNYYAAISMELAGNDPNTGTFDQRNSVFKLTSYYGGVPVEISECLHGSGRNENSWNNKVLVINDAEEGYDSTYAGNGYSAVKITCTPLNMDSSFKFRWYNISGSYSSYTIDNNSLTVYKTLPEVFRVYLDITGSSGEVETWFMTCI